MTEHIIVKIFHSLDFKSLRNVEQVCKGWAELIEEWKVWEKLFKKNVSLLFVLVINFDF